MRELVSRLPGVPRERLRDLLGQLLVSGLLEPATAIIEPGAEPTDLALKLLESLGAPEAEVVRQLSEGLSGPEVIEADLGTRWSRLWSGANEQVTSLGDVDAGRRLDHQLLMDMPAAVLDQRTADDLVAAVLRLQHLQGQVGAGPGAGEIDLTEIVREFEARYEDAEVPLLEALDPESGVMVHPRRQASLISTEAGVRAVESESGSASLPDAVLAVYRRALRSDGPVDISDMPADTELTGRGIAAALLDPGRSEYSAMLIGAIGRSPLALMGRFALGRPEVERMVARMVEAEASARVDADQTADPIRAELVAHPGGRIGNVLLRPRVHAECIALGGARGGTLDLDRLSIRVSGGSLALRDRVSGRPVVLELTSAHNTDFPGLDPIYALLGRLAGGGGSRWTWGALDRLDHLPRITCGSVIVSPEQWRLNAAQVAEVRASARPAVQLRELLGIDAGRRWVGVGEMDHILPLDLDGDHSVRCGLGRRDVDVKLVELPQCEAPATHGPHGGHVTEVHLGAGPVLRPAPVPAATDIDHRAEHANRWAYGQIFCGTASADRLVDRAAALAERLRGDGLIDQWFFLRYASRGHHLRVRLRATTDQGRGQVLLALGESARVWQDEQLASRLVVEPYIPEVGRYGGHHNLERAEQLFDISSTAAARFVAGCPTEEDRLHRAVADATVFAHAVAPECAADRIAFLRRCQGGLGMRFDRQGNRQGKLYREHRGALAEAVAGAATGSELAEAVAALVKSVQATKHADRLVSIVGSSLHLHCNRLFAFDAVRMEFLTHEFALRQVREAAARMGERV